MCCKSVFYPLSPAEVAPVTLLGWREVVDMCCKKRVLPAPARQRRTARGRSELKLGKLDSIVWVISHAAGGVSRGGWEGSITQECP